MKKTKKAQIQNMETITVVIIIIILIIIGIVYAANQRSISAQKEGTRTQDLLAMEITTNTLNLDFVKCSEDSASTNTCIDYFKIKALSEHTFKEENYLHFYRLFADSEIKIRILKNITQKDALNENITIYKTDNTENKTRTRINTPVTVKDPARNINYFAIMEVSTYR